MLIQLDDHALVNALCAHYMRSGFTAEPVGGGMIEVTRPNALTEGLERADVVLHLRVWEVTNPDVTVSIVG